MSTEATDSQSRSQGRPRHTATALAALYAGGLLTVIGGYFHLNGFDAAISEPIGPALTAASPFSPQFGAEASRPVQPGAPLSTGQKIARFLSRDSDTTRWVFILGCTVSIWGLWTLRKLSPATDPAAAYLRSAYQDGIDPTTLHTQEDLDDLRRIVADRHQRKVLWSLPFWFTTLVLLVVNKGTLGNETPLGLSDLWLIAITLGVYLLYAYIYWRCPACEAHLPRFDHRLTCDKCGLRLNAPRITYAPPPVEPEQSLVKTPSGSS